MNKLSLVALRDLQQYVYILYMHVAILCIVIPFSKCSYYYISHAYIVSCCAWNVMAKLINSCSTILLDATCSTELVNHDFSICSKFSRCPSLCPQTPADKAMIFFLMSVVKYWTAISNWFVCTRIVIYKLCITRRLVDALEVYRNMTEQDELPNLQEFPKGISVAKAIATWKHIVNYQTKRN